MSKRRLAPELDKDLAGIRSKHPLRTTDCGALLAEIASSGSSHRNRASAASLYWHIECQRGLRTLDRVLRGVRAEIEAALKEENQHVVGPKRHLHADLLFAIAQIDNSDSHRVLTENLSVCKNSYLLSDVLECMAFEKRMFDIDLVLSFVAEHTREEVLLSALYCLHLHGESSVGSVIVRRRLASLLEHVSSNVRYFAIMAMRADVDSLALIQRLADDPCEEVRDAVQQALWIHGLDGA